MPWLLAASVSCLIFCTIVLATFVPLQNPNGVEYLFAAPRASTLWTVWSVCVAILVTAFMAVRASAPSQQPDTLGDAQSGRWLAPIAALAVLGLGILPAVPGIGEKGAVLGYFLYDLRWWWAILLVAVAIARVDRLVGAPLGRAASGIRGWPLAVRLLLLDAVLFVGVVTWAITTTAIRFDHRLSGDEPKYVRYCEAWYQGQGFDISQLALVRDQPVDASPALLQNGARFVRAIRQDMGALAGDIRAFVREPSTFQWNRASSNDGFVTGIHGGLYQIHESGVCAVLFPGYFIDRYLLSVNSSPDGKWPDELVMTNVMMLLTYGICAVLLFRLLRHALGSDSLAWIWAAMAMLTLPTAAFAFQLYPELPALLIILGVSHGLLFAARTPSGYAAAAAGAATGALAWLHPRFLLICLCLAVVAAFTKTGAARRAFLATCGFVLFAVMALNYHVTGSWSPIARMEADGQGVTLNNVGFVLNFIGYGLDRRLGLIPHAVLLLGALPGLFVLGRESRRLAVFVALIVLALVVPASGYSLVSAGTTPDRFVAAVVPLLIWPVAVLVRRFWASGIFRVLTVALGIMSLDSAVAYNWYHDKAFSALRDASISGWKPNLAFPIIRGEGWTSQANFVLALLVLALVLGLTWLAWREKGDGGLFEGPTRKDPRPLFRWLLPTIAIFALIGVFSIATSANQDWTHPLYLVDDGTARVDAARAVVSADNRCFCFTSEQGHIDWTAMKPNSARIALVGLYPDELQLTVQVLVQGDGNIPAFGRMRVEFGDGEQTTWSGVVAERRIVHTYRQPGTYPVRVWFQLPTRVAPQLHRETVEVRAAK